MSGIKLEVGRRYVSRDARFGVVKITHHDGDDFAPFIGDDGCAYHADGRGAATCRGEEGPGDLIALAPDEAPQPQPALVGHATPDSVLAAAEAVGKLVAIQPDELATLRERVRELEGRLFPYADEKEIAGMSWEGFHLIGNSKSVTELQRICHRSGQLDEFQKAFDARLEAERARVMAAERDRDTLRAENARLKYALELAYETLHGAAWTVDRAQVVAAALAQTEAENG